jgi:hypothetical protein
MTEGALALAADRKSVEILVHLDADAGELSEYQDWCLSKEIVWTVGPRASVPSLMNSLAGMARGHILMAASDDIAFRTRHWDKKVKAAFEDRPDGFLVAYTNDGRGRQKCEHFFTTRRWMETVGYFMPDGLEHFAGDAWVEDIARRVGRLLYLPEVITEHRHFKYGKADFDATYQRTRVPDASGVPMAQRDTLVMTARTKEREMAAEKIREAMKAPMVA